MHLAAWERLFRRTQPFRKSKVLGYAFATAILLVATGIRFAIGNISPGGLPFLTTVPSIVLVAVVAGTGPAALVALVGALAAVAFYATPEAGGLTPSRLLALGVYVLTAWAIIAVISASAEAIRRVDEHNERLERQRSQLATMFRELQHRVANNLQLVSGFVTHSRRKLGSHPELADQIFEDLNARLVTMAKVHRQLHDPENAGQPFVDHASELCQMVLASTAGPNVRCTVGGAKDVLPLDVTQTASLFLVEAVINSVKHAFPDGREGVIDVSLASEAPGHRFVLSIADNGVGRPAGASKIGGVGSRIMQSLAAQLGGEATVSHDEAGTQTVLTFSVSASGSSVH